MLLSFVREKNKSWHQHNQTECVHFTKAFKVYYQKNEWGVWKYNTDLDTCVKIQRKTEMKLSVRQPAHYSP